MADISDVSTYFYQQAALALYPNGTPTVGQPTASTIAGMDVLIYEGWPIPEKLDLDLTGKMLVSQGDGTSKVVDRPGGPRANVSIYPMVGTGIKIYQILDETKIIVPPVFGLGIVQAMAASNFTITITGTPGATEFITIELDQFDIVSATGGTAAAILATLATQINALGRPHGGFYTQYVATVVGSVLTIAGAVYCLTRAGSQGTLGNVTHRQQDHIMVSAWCPDHLTRSRICTAIDILIKHNLKITMPDTSDALIVYSRTNTSDELEGRACYRRDLIYCADYATVEQFQGTVITSVSTSIKPNDPTQNFITTTSAA